MPNDEFQRGDRVMVFDHRLFRDDESTPLSHTMRPAHVVRSYTRPSYGKLLDVVFEYDGYESRAHFAQYIKKVEDDQ